MSLLQESIHILKCCRKSQGLRDDITVLRSLPAIFQKPGKPLSIIEPVPQVQMPVLAFFFFFFLIKFGVSVVQIRTYFITRLCRFFQAVFCRSLKRHETPSESGIFSVFASIFHPVSVLREFSGARAFQLTRTKQHTIVSPRTCQQRSLAQWSQISTTMESFLSGCFNADFYLFLLSFRGIFSWDSAVLDLEWSWASLSLSCETFVNDCM